MKNKLRQIEEARNVEVRTLSERIDGMQRLL